MEYELSDCSSERQTIINSEMLMTLFYGIYSSVFWRAITLGMRKGGSRHSDAYAAHRSRIQGNPAFFIVAIVMYSLVTVVFVIQWKTLYDVFGPNGGNGRYLCTGSVAPALPIFFECVFALNIILADLVLIWRTYVVFSKIKRILILPGMLVLCTAVFALYFTISRASTGIHEAREGGAPIFELVFGMRDGFQFVDPVVLIAYFGCSMLITLYCSISITVRIFKMCRFGGTSLKSYSNILEVVAESSALYTICSSITVALMFISPNMGSRYAVAVLLSVTGIAPTWVLARVISGKARTDKSWTIGSFPLGSDPEAIGFQPNQLFANTDGSAAYAPVQMAPRQRNDGHV